MSEPPRAILAIANFVVVVSILAACAGDDANTLRIDGIDVSYEELEYEHAPGQFTLEFRNEGQLAHNIVFEPVEGGPVAAGENEYLLAGDSARYELDLRAGEYAFYCSVPGHREAGMAGTLVIG